MKAKPFLALLTEGNKLDAYQKRFMLTASIYPYQDEDGQQNIKSSLTLPDDVLSDILEADQVDDINKIKDALEDGN
jgi:hypothetical protein